MITIPFTLSGFVIITLSQTIQGEVPLMRVFFCFAFKLQATGILCFLSWFIYATETDTKVLYKRTNLDPDLFCECRGELPGSRETGNLVDGFVGCRYWDTPCLIHTVLSVRCSGVRKFRGIVDVVTA